MLEFVGLGFLARPWLSDIDTVLDRGLDSGRMALHRALHADPVRGDSSRCRRSSRRRRELDGAIVVAVFREIRFPYIRPVWITTMIMAATYALRGFDIPYLLTNGGPGPGVRAADHLHVQDRVPQHRLRLREHDLGLHRRRVHRRSRPDHPVPPHGSRR